MSRRSTVSVTPSAILPEAQSVKKTISYWESLAQ